MGRLAGYIAVILAISILAVIVSGSAQTIPKPSVPQFNVKFVDASYNVAPSSSINPYTGQNITVDGYHVENRTIELIIKNQPFTSYIQNGENISFYYNVRWRGHYETNWTNVYTVDNYFTSESKSDFTTLVYLVDSNCPPFWDHLVNGGTADFQVQAMIGYIGRTVGFASWYFSGETSDWSSTQTITIDESSVFPSVPEFSITAILSLLVVLPLIAIVLMRKKRK
jgi:hypothetical protein